MKQFRTSRTTVMAASMIAAGALVLAGCGDDSDSGSMPGMDHGAPSSTAASPSTTQNTAPVDDHNDADVKFAKDMIPHHRQAVEMADLALKNASNAEVKQLATAIKQAQDPEIQTMSGWLTSWGQPVPTPMAGHDMSAGMPGMMTMEEMAELEKATGSAFDQMWLQMMVKHHQGAVAMAKTEQTTGKAEAAVALAKKIETDQNREIATMQKLLGTLTGR
ncbi:DUF305 domain-containing protein [Kribbella sp. DT2]|uniref:DUF305 domain-containing protein n=1 Tax=Kribbella sp. DT2 TaxID=3393427 RepID=UPI003CF94E47